MKLRKFLKRVGSEVNPSSLKQTGFDFQKIVKTGLLALSAVTVVLLAVFVIWPVFGTRKAKPSQDSDLQLRRVPLKYAIKNNSGENWNSLTLRIKTFGETIEGSASARQLDWSIDGSSGTFDFGIGDVPAGGSKEFTVYVKTWESEPQRYKLSFLVRSGEDEKVVHEANATPEVER